MELRGISSDTVNQISKIKKEDSWVLEYRKKSYDYFNKIPLPSFGPKIDIDFDSVIYYKGHSPEEASEMANNWDHVDQKVRDELDTLGVLESENHLDGMGVQYESEVIYHNMIDELRKKNIIFTSIEDGLKYYPDISRKYFGKIVSNTENKFAALNGAVFSGGSFIYIPPYTKLVRPLQSYFRINSRSMGQFERTLIIVDHDSELHYIEGCTAPTYTEDALHAAVVEIYVKKGAKCRYTTIQNWSSDVYNLVTKRAIVEESGTMEWIDGNIGSKTNMKYPSCILVGENAVGNCISIAVATKDQYQDTGAKMIHLAPNTKSNIISKSIAANGGIANYRGTVNISKDAINSKSIVKCDTIILDDKSKSDTIPKNKVSNSSSTLEHEATVSKIDEDKLFYLMSRGIPEERAKELLIMGFIDKFREELPMEYAVELNALLKNYF